MCGLRAKHGLYYSQMPRYQQYTSFYFAFLGFRIFEFLDFLIFAFYYLSISVFLNLSISQFSHFRILLYLDFCILPSEFPSWYIHQLLQIFFLFSLQRTMA